MLCSTHTYGRTELVCQEIGWTHMRVLEGVGTLVQLGGLMSRLCKVVGCFIARFFRSECHLNPAGDEAGVIPGIKTRPTNVFILSNPTPSSALSPMLSHVPWQSQFLINLPEDIAKAIVGSIHVRWSTTAQNCVGLQASHLHPLSQGPMRERRPFARG